MMNRVLRRASAALVCVFIVGGIARAEPAAGGDRQAHLKAAWQAASAAMQRGPRSVPLADQAQLDLPQGYAFVPRKEAMALMELWGNKAGDQFIGLVFPLGEAEWFATLEYEPSGHVRDDEARDWEADKLFETLRKSTEEGNKHRREIGVPAIEVTRWIEKPAYDATAHRLVWSAEARQIGAPAMAEGSANYNTFVLGREGFISMDAVAAVSKIEQHKDDAKALLADIHFKNGKAYGDFNASTDKVAAYGIAALVGGIAAKKLGLFALMGLGFAKFAKVIAVAVASAGAAATKIFKRRKS
jgi:uncharacterized membrane-anchored protein